LSFAVLADAFSLRWPSPPAQAALDTAVETEPAGDRLPATPYLADESDTLAPFFAALWSLEHGRSNEVITVLHYGDSPTTADLITGDIRSRMQRRFGDAGRGYTLIARPWAWYGHRGVEISDDGWKIRTGVGLAREGIYGLGGAAFEGSVGAWS